MHEFTYAHGRYYRDGEPFFLVATEYHYHRDRRDHWRDRLEKLKAAGANCINFYIPWRHHMHMEGDRRVYDFTGRTKDSRDLVTWMETIEDLGLLMIVKPGPFIHSELNVGGLPDLVSPTFSPAVPPQRRHHGKPALWGYDASALPAPFDHEFDNLCREWLYRVREVIRPFVRDGGPVIGFQINDETIYCTSNDPPWHIGYEPSGMKFFHEVLRRRYGSIEHYNRVHRTEWTAFDFVPAPHLPSSSGMTVEDYRPKSEADLIAYIDWAEYQWRLRRELYVRYKHYLGYEHYPHLTNYAGITPPIVENVPDQKEHAKEPIPKGFEHLYPEWWFAMNRVDRDARDGAYEYGLISWLGVAAYDEAVFFRYVNTARRARGINMEENWGFATLYDSRSKDPIVPFFQTLLSVAAGATGYVIFLGVSTDYWDDDLDRTTKKQCPTFPSDAPIDEHGNLRPMYDTMRMLNQFFREHGDALLDCEIETDIAYLLYSPYAAVSSWIPNDEFWSVKDRSIPRCGRHGFEDFSMSVQLAGYTCAMFELEGSPPSKFFSAKALVIHSAFFMDLASQTKLVHFIRAGGRLFISGELPEVDLELNPCTLLKGEVEKKPNNVFYREENLPGDVAFPGVLFQLGFSPSIRRSSGLRVFVHEGGRDRFVFFFIMDASHPQEKTLEYKDLTIKLKGGPKTSGVLRLTEGKLTGYMVKGKNEVEGVTATVRIEVAGQVIEKSGDFTSVGA